MQILTPFLTEMEPELSSEGSLDPLGLYSLADALAMQLVPGVRERQLHPRFLTAMAVGAVVCDSLEDMVARDGVTEPWQVFEWYMVEGLVRSCGSGEDFRGLPGSDKAREAIGSGVHLSARRYLKTPAVFGFHGVYRRLAEELQIIDDAGGLGVNGPDLVSVWMEEQGLEGFCLGSGETGKSMRQKLSSAVRDGLEKGAVTRGGSWYGWRFFEEHLLHTQILPREAEFLKQLLLDDRNGYRGEVLRFLVSDEARGFWNSREILERRFHKAIAESNSTSKGLKQLLNLIMTYETFSSLLIDAFFDCLHIMTLQHGKTPLEKFVDSPYVSKASSEITKNCEELNRKLDSHNLSHRFSECARSFSAFTSEKAFVERLFEHHRNIQRAKRKAPWFETTVDGAVYIKPAHRVDEPEPFGNEYVHRYRIRPLLSFAKDLKMIKS